MEGRHGLLLLFLFLMAECHPILDENLRVVRKNQDMMMQQMHCVENSTIHHSYSNGETLQDCICDASHNTVMSREDVLFGCFTPAEIGCTLSMGGSHQAYSIRTPEHWEGDKKVNVTPKLPDSASIERIYLWNLQDLELARGNWTDVTREGMFVFTLDDNSSLIIAQEHEFWYGHVVKICFLYSAFVRNSGADRETIGGSREDSGRCVVAKFEERVDSYPFNIENWRKQFPPAPTTTASSATTSSATTSSVPTGTMTTDHSTTNQTTTRSWNDTTMKPMPTHAAQHGDDSIATFILVPFFVALLLLLGCYLAYVYVYRKKMRKDKRKVSIRNSVVEPI